MGGLEGAPGQAELSLLFVFRFLRLPQRASHGQNTGAIFSPLRLQPTNRG
jgi:hypothetical protein